MEITLAIKYLYPTLEFWKDFQVLDDNQWAWPYIIWNTEDPTEPTQQELETAWAACVIQEEIQVKMDRIYEINSELVKLNYPWVAITIPSILALNDAKRLVLEAEAVTIQADIVASYDSTLIDDIYTSLFL
jgi:hypothetical protein